MSQRALLTTFFAVGLALGAAAPGVAKRSDDQSAHEAAMQASQARQAHQHGTSPADPAAYPPELLEVRKVGFMAGASRQQRRELSAACDAAAASVRAALDGADTSDVSEAGGRSLNAAAEQAWRSYLARRAEVLTEEQIARLAAAIEHPGGHEH